MAQLGGIRARYIFVVLLVVLSVAIFSGCNIVDTIRPDINDADKLVVDPEVLSNIFEGVAADSGDSSSSGDTGSGIPSSSGAVSVGGSSSTPSTTGGTASGSTGSHGTITSPADTSVASVPVVVATTNKMCKSSVYEKYLKEEIVDPILEILKKHDEAGDEQIYFRVMHMGYDYDASSGKLYAAPIYRDTSQANGVSKIAGTPVISFAYNLFTMENSYNILQTQARASQLLAILDRYKSETGATTSSKYMDCKNLDNYSHDLYLMWSSPKYKNLNLGKFTQKLKADPPNVLAIPNLQFRYPISADMYSSVKLNAISSMDTEFNHGVDQRTVDAIFTSYTQTPKGTTKSFGGYSDDENKSSMMYSYCDSFNKTIIFIGTDTSSNLKTILGNSDFTKVQNLIKNCKSVLSTDVASKYGEGNIIPVGAKL